MEPLHGERFTLLQATHWDDKAARQEKNFYPDPQVVYVRHEPPYKNHSVIELKQSKDVSFVSEQKAQFLDNAGNSRRDSFRPKESQVYLGDDPPELETQ